MEIPELGEYVEESNEEENMSNFYDEIFINPTIYSCFTKFGQ